MKLSRLLLLFVLASTARAEVDTVVRDYDIDLTPTECRQTAMRLFPALAEIGIAVRDQVHIMYYTDSCSELFGV